LEGYFLPQIASAAIHIEPLRGSAHSVLILLPWISFMAIHIELLSSSGLCFVIDIETLKVRK